MNLSGLMEQAAWSGISPLSLGYVADADLDSEEEAPAKVWAIMPMNRRLLLIEHGSGWGETPYRLMPQTPPSVTVRTSV